MDEHPHPNSTSTPTIQNNGHDGKMNGGGSVISMAAKKKAAQLYQQS
jgi:hypothetical protein